MALSGSGTPRRVVVSAFVTLDGVAEAPGGEPGHPHSGWVGDLMGPEEQAMKLAEAERAGSLLLDRLTYEQFAAVWPRVDGPFGDRMNALPKRVVSTTLGGGLPWNAAVLDDGPVDGVERLRRDGVPGDEGRDLLVVGSITLVHALLGNALVDELRLLVFPVSVGGGRRLFPDDLRRHDWRPAGRQDFPSGSFLLTCRPT